MITIQASDQRVVSHPRGASRYYIIIQRAQGKKKTRVASVATEELCSSLSILTPRGCQRSSSVLYALRWLSPRDPPGYFIATADISTPLIAVILPYFLFFSFLVFWFLLFSVQAQTWNFLPTKIFHIFLNKIQLIALFLFRPLS